MWGGGWLASNGAKDFAGGIVIHATAGTSGLVACTMIGFNSPAAFQFPRGVSIPPRRFNSPAA
jgi:ammonia channel protein AmtB